MTKKFTLIDALNGFFNYGQNPTGHPRNVVNGYLLLAGVNLLHSD
jgi:hypothetical protein